MPPEGYQSITVSDETANLLAQVMISGDLDNMSEAVTVSAKAALDQDLGRGLDLEDVDDLDRTLQQLHEAHLQIASSLGELQERL